MAYLGTKNLSAHSVHIRIIEICLSPYHECPYKDVFINFFAGVSFTLSAKRRTLCKLYDRRAKKYFGL